MIRVSSVVNGGNAVAANTINKGKIKSNDIKKIKIKNINPLGQIRIRGGQ